MSKEVKNIVESKATVMNDKSMLERVKEIFGGDENLAKNLLNIYIKESTKDLSLLQEGIQSKDIDKVNKVSHKIKSSFKFLGMNNAVELCLYFEKLTHFEENTLEIKQKISTLIELHQISITDIEGCM